MFIPKIYQCKDRELMKKIIHENAFAMLISDKEKLCATHSMFLLNDDQEDFYLETHISNANFQAKVLKNGDAVLCDFLGAHSYISSSWYAEVNVSTWNYEAVQIRGVVQLMSDEQLFRHLEKLTSKYESLQKCPMLVENMNVETVKKEMNGAFGVNILPTEIHIANKISQNRNERDFENIILNLEQSDFANDKEIAKLMKKNRSLI